MKSAINIDGRGCPETIAALAVAISDVLSNGHETFADQETIRAALNLLGQAAGVNGTQITHCTFKADGCGQCGEK